MKTQRSEMNPQEKQMNTQENPMNAQEQELKADRKFQAKYFCIAFHGDLSEETAAGLAEAFLRFTPDVMIRPRAIFLEVGRCLSLYSEASLELRLRRVLNEWSIPSERVTIGKSTQLARAWLLASHRVGRVENRAQETIAIARLPISALSEVIDPLGRREQTKPEERGKIRAMIEVLFLLGIRTLGSLRKLPPDSAVSRFGKLYETVLQNLDEDTEVLEAWERFKPIERMSERVDPDPGETLWEVEPVLFETKRLLDRILRRCAGRGKAIAKLELKLECETRRNIRENWTTVCVNFTFPQTDSVMILRMMREKLAHAFSTLPLEAPIVAIELDASELAPRKSAQSNFFDTEETRLESLREGWRDLVTLLSTKLQPAEELFQAELLPAWRPEKSWRRTLGEPDRIRPLSLPIPSRPLRLLTPPEELRRLGRYLFWRTERMRIASFDRVERLSGEWWDSEGGFARTYYRVRARAGDTGGNIQEHDLWVFREQGDGGERGGIYLHGIF